jgi:hypothetical protein
VAQPPNSPRGQDPGRGARRSRSGLGMAVGFALCVVGFILIILNYSNNPSGFNFGVGMFLVGVILLGVSSLRRDRQDHRQNGNSRA